VKPSILTGVVIAGSAEEGAIVWAPEPGIKKLMMFGGGLEFESRIACRREPAPESPMVVTVYVAARADPLIVSSATANAVNAFTQQVIGTDPAPAEICSDSLQERLTARAVAGAGGQAGRHER
jgi:hypothetical protein